MADNRERFLSTLEYIKKQTDGNLLQGVEISGMHDRDLERLVEVVDGNEVVSRLSFPNNRFTDEAASWIAHLIENKPILTGIDLSTNDISKIGMQEIARSARSSANLISFTSYHADGDPEKNSSAKASLLQSIQAHCQYNRQEAEKCIAIISAKDNALGRLTKDEAIAIQARLPAIRAMMQEREVGAFHIQHVLEWVAKQSERLGVEPGMQVPPAPSEPSQELPKPQEPWENRMRRPPRSDGHNLN